MWRFFLILVAVFAVISMPRVSDGEWQILPIAVAFAASLTVIGAGFSSAVAAWPYMAPRILILDAGLTVLVVIVGALFVSHPLGFVALVCVVCGASLAVVLGVALAGWVHSIRLMFVRRQLLVER